MCLGQNLLTPFELIFLKMNILELGGFGPTAEICTVWSNRKCVMYGDIHCSRPSGDLIFSNMAPFFNFFFWAFMPLLDSTVVRQEMGREMGGDMRQRLHGSGVEPATPPGHCSPSRVH